MINTNKTSEDELGQELERLYRCVVYDLIDDADRKELWIKEVGVVVQALIRVEKLKLLEEVRERVVGEGDLVDAETLKKLYDRAYSRGYDDRSYENSYNSQDYRSAEDIAPVIAKIRGGYEKRSAALTKMEAEL